MYLKKIYWMAIIAAWISFIYLQESAFSSDVYFANREIKNQILSAIEECRDSIDIAVSDIASHDFLNALIKAQERGVTVRMVVGKKPTFLKQMLPGIDKDKKFLVKILSRKGRRHGNFAIFDSQLLATGSYPWRKNVGNNNRYDLIFTDETILVVKYQREFDRLFQEERTADGQMNAVVEEKKRGKSTETGTSDIVSKRVDTANQMAAPNDVILIPEAADGSILMSFEDFDKIFGMVSDLSEEQKERLWSRCQGKRVTWNGEVAYIGWGLVTGWMMSIKYGDTSVEIKMNPTHKDHFSQVEFGNTVTYTGKLDSRVTRVFPYKLEDGDVLHVENTLPRPVRGSEPVEDPFVVPVSQGPKKIFLVDSFEDLKSIFGKESEVSEAQKEIAWGKYKGKYVSWTGQITYKNINVASGLRMGITQKVKGDVEVRFSLAKKDKVLNFQDGETIFYTGKLVERCGDNTPFILEDGDIMTMKVLNLGIGGM